MSKEKNLDFLINNFILAGKQLKGEEHEKFSYKKLRSHTSFIHFKIVRSESALYSEVYVASTTKFQMNGNLYQRPALAFITANRVV